MSSLAVQLGSLSNSVRAFEPESAFSLKSVASEVEPADSPAVAANISMADAAKLDSSLLEPKARLLAPSSEKAAQQNETKKKGSPSEPPTANLREFDAAKEGSVALERSGRAQAPQASAAPVKSADGSDVPLIAQARNDRSDLLRFLEPDAFALGFSTGAGPLAPQGQFVLRTAAGNWGSFSSKLLKPLPSIPTPHGEIKHGISLVGTIAQDGRGGLTDQAGVGWSAKVPTPLGDVLLFANTRQDYATIGHIFDDREGRHVLNVTLGVGYSISDGAAQALAAKFPKVGAPLRTGLNATGTDVWAGAAYAAQLVVQNGVPSALIISGVEIPLDQLATLFGDEVESSAMSGGYRPESLNNSPLRNFDPVHTNATQLGVHQRRVIERAFERGLTTPQEQHQAMRRAIDDPASAFPDLPPNGRRVAVAILNAILGRTAEADRVLETVYARDNPTDGVRPRGFGALASPELARLEQGRVSGQRVSHGFAGVPGIGQLEVRWNPSNGEFSAHGPNNAQYPLRGVTSVEEARERTRELIRNGAVSRENMLPL